MSLTAGVVTQVSVYIDTASLAVTAATGGVGPYTYQWYRSLTPSFTPGPGNILAGKTALTLNDTGLSALTNYYYSNVATDTDDSSTDESNQLEVTTLMATTAGALSHGLITSTTAALISAAATGGSSPYTYQWYRSTVSGFTPGVGNILSGQTSLTFTDSGLTPGVKYYYEVIATDSGSVTGASAQLGIVMAAGDPLQNQFSQSPFLGMPDLLINQDTIACQVDVSQATPILSGQAIKIVDVAGGIPKVVSCAADTDDVFGFVTFNIKDRQYIAGDRLEISQTGNVIWLQATTAISSGARVCLDTLYVGGVQAITGSSAKRIVGYSYDKVSQAALVRVKVGARFLLDS